MPIEDAEDGGHSIGALGEVGVYAAGLGDDAAGADEDNEGLEHLPSGDEALGDEPATVPKVEGPVASNE